MRAAFLFFVMFAVQAQARFGKSNSGGEAPKSNQSSGNSSSSSSSGSSSNTTSASSPTPSSPFGAWNHRRSDGAPLSMYYAPPPTIGFFAIAPQQTLSVEERASDTDPKGPLRMTVGIEGEVLLTQDRGAGAAILATVEGERFGVSIFGSHLVLSADDGSESTDTLNQLNAHLTYAFLSGSAGRLRGEIGFDMVIAPDIGVIGPTIGISGSLWQFSPVAFEGAFNVTPYPFLQVEGRAGIAYGIGPVGLRIGYRLQMLDDRGLADGVVHRDYFGGPYVGLSVVL